MSDIKPKKDKNNVQRKSFRLIFHLFILTINPRKMKCLFLMFKSFIMVLPDLQCKYVEKTNKSMMPHTAWTHVPL